MPTAELDQYIATAFGSAGVRFYHADNLRHFSLHYQHKALLAKSELIKLDSGYTRFYSDKSDEESGALDRVFGNIYDFGAIFARAPGTTPNIYGPITLVFRSTSFASMRDIAITPKSIVTYGADWQRARVHDQKTIDTIVGGDGFGGPVARSWQMCEVSFAGPSLQLSLLERILVEPIRIGGKSLLSYVREAAPTLGSITLERPYSYKKHIANLRDLAATCERIPRGTENDSWRFSVEDLPSGWETLAPVMRRRLPGWCRYFYFGTVAHCHVVDLEEEAAADAADHRTPCDICDPGEDHGPAFVTYDDTGDDHLEIGHCDWCNSIAVRCKECGTSWGIYESHYNKTLECIGGCGARFRVTSTVDYEGETSTSFVTIEAKTPPESDFLDPDYLVWTPDEMTPTGRCDHCGEPFEGADEALSCEDGRTIHLDCWDLHVGLLHALAKD